ncbi:hypothetical protein NPIL_386781 [Nephila pilipes]|uniref:Uncharacterized protein n=1 Tax=Nephila pilipes TaxID=299642 RepID=A0A8X6U2B8_NEPPI|nr:hypothetical protein NPIL_386781 [Nephila pilipes]
MYQLILHLRSETVELDKFSLELGWLVYQRHTVANSDNSRYEPAISRNYRHDETHLSLAPYLLISPLCPEDLSLTSFDVQVSSLIMGLFCGISYHTIRGAFTRPLLDFNGGVRTQVMKEGG